MPPTLRYMRVSDVPRVLVIDQSSFGMPWSAQAYANEVTRFTYSHMAVIARPTPTPGGVRGLLQGLWGPRLGPELLAYGGFWLLDGEAHVNTIASHPNHRREGWGELLLAAMLRKAIRLAATSSVLEVRVSNTPAQTLYRRYGYTVEEVRAGYYRDNNEDAYYMRLPLANQPATAAMIEARYQALGPARGVQDDYTETERPEVTV